MSTVGAMSKSERDELSRLVKARARIAKATVDQRSAELLADVERQLAAKYSSSHDAWADVTATAEQAVTEADAVVAARCRDLGIPEEFRPRLYLSWSSRGENADRERRGELRRVASTRIDALARQAKLAIEHSALDLQTRLAIGALGSDEAQAFLASMPTVEALMPALEVEALPLALGAAR